MIMIVMVVFVLTGSAFVKKVEMAVYAKTFCLTLLITYSIVNLSFIFNMDLLGSLFEPVRTEIKIPLFII